MTSHEDEIIVLRNVEEEMKESYLRYSMSVIVSRALPDVRDGLKPSQRRILYAMRQLNLGPNAKFRKCAKICGDTSGDYHPHGESVIYPTLVRLAQNWVMRYPLVQGQGNFGSVDGDSPAAMRYTEARLTGASVELMEDLEKNTVDLVPNYDETRLEPTVLPSKIPNLLCNGSSGIAVGMATNIPPHNLKELTEATLMLLENPQTTIEDIMTVMPGPDFPSGGIICGARGIREAYHTGRGKLTLRAVVDVEDIPGSNDRQMLVIPEIPYNVNKSRLIERIAELINHKDITGISDLRDESDKDGMRIVIELKRGEIPDVVINQLFKFTDLQVTFGCNMLALDNGLPRTMNIRQMIAAWIDHRIEVVRRRTRFELEKAEARAHVLEGYLKAIDHMDEVVKLIRASASRDAAKQELIELFSFSDRQAHAVLDLRLYQLTALEHDKIENEYKDLQEKIDYYRRVLADEGLVRQIIREELTASAAKVKGDRKTQIIGAEGDFNMEDLIADQPAIITVSHDDYIKRMPVETFREQRRGGQGIAGMDKKREGDSLKNLYVASTHDHLLIFTNSGRVYWIKVWQIPETGRRSKGRPLVNLLEGLREDEEIATVLKVRSFEDQKSVLLATKKGVVKKTALKAFSNPRKTGIYAISIDEGDEVIAARLVEEGQSVMLFTRGAMTVRFDESQVREMGRTARGVRGVLLRKDDDAVVGCEAVTGDESVLVVCENGYGKRSLVEDFRQTHRGGVGVRSIIASERNGAVVAALSVADEDGVVMMTGAGQAVRIPMDGVRVMGRSTQGVRLANLKNGDTLIAVQKLEGESSLEEEEGAPTEGEAQTAAVEMPVNEAPSQED